MLRLSPPGGLRLSQTTGFEAHFGGSEANVAVALSHWARSAAYVTRLPAHALGHSALASLARYGVDTRACVYGGERLGTYYIEYGAGLRGTQVLYDRNYSGMATLSPGMIDWAAVLQGAGWLHWSGITPALSQSAADATLEALQAAAQQQLLVSCDLNYREKLWQYGKTPAQVMPQLVEYTQVLLGDATAFDLYFGIREKDERVLMQRLQERFPGLRYIAMSSREAVSSSRQRYRGMLFDGKELYVSRDYDLGDMLDRIGSGDAFMAGLLHALNTNGATAQHAVEFATAAGALKHYIYGDYSLCTEDEVLALMAGDTGGRVKR